MNKISIGKMMLEGKHSFKTDILPKCFAPHKPNWLSRTIPMSKYFSGSRPL